MKKHIKLFIWIEKGKGDVGNSKIEPIESDEMFPATSNQEGAPLRKHTHQSFGPKFRMRSAEIASTSTAQVRTIGNSSKSEVQEEKTRILSTIEDVKHVTKQAFHLEA